MPVVAHYPAAQVVSIVFTDYADDRVFQLLSASDQQHPDNPQVHKFRLAFKRVLGGSAPASAVSDPPDHDDEDSASSQEDGEISDDCH